MNFYGSFSHLQNNKALKHTVRYYDIVQSFSHLQNNKALKL